MKRMIGFIVATCCALGLVFLARRRRQYGGYGLYRVFQRLETTPGQEQVIRTAASQLKDAGKRLRDEARDARPDLAELLRAEKVDEEAMRSWFAARERAIDDFKPELIGAFKEIHEVLDPIQRKKLGDFVESGGRGFFSRGRCHHYHHGWGNEWRQTRCGGAC